MRRSAEKCRFSSQASLVLRGVASAECSHCRQDWCQNVDSNEGKSVTSQKRALSLGEAVGPVHLSRLASLMNRTLARSMNLALRYLAFGLMLRCLPPAVQAASDSPRPEEKSQVLIAHLRRSGLNKLWLPATVEHVKGSISIDTGSPLTALSDAKYRFLLKGDAHRLPPGVPVTTPLNALKARVALAHDLSLGGHDLGAALVALVPERLHR